MFGGQIERYPPYHTGKMMDRNILSQEFKERLIMVRLQKNHPLFILNASSLRHS